MDTFIKQPREVLDYDVNLTEWFSDMPIDDIDSVTVTISSFNEEVPTLIAGALPHPVYELLGDTPVQFKIWLSGGTDFVDYIVTCLIVTEQDRQKEVEFKIKVRDK